LQDIIDFMPTRLLFFHNWRSSWISQNAQGWQIYTHLETFFWTPRWIIKKKKLYPRLKT